MERRLLLLEGDVQRGELLCRDEGCYMLCCVDVPMWESGVKKVWLCSQGGGRVLLGTLVPEDGRLRLHRRISHSTLRCCGLGPLECARINPQEEERSWHSLSTLSTGDSALDKRLRAHPEGLWRRDESALRLRFPWQAGKAVPMMSLFCFGCSRDGWWEIDLPPQLSAEQQ
jgi:hypothetical protein